MRLFLYILFTSILIGCVGGKKSTKSTHVNILPIELDSNSVISISDNNDNNTTLNHDIEEKDPNILVGHQNTNNQNIKIVNIEKTKIYKESHNEGKVVYKVPSIMSIRETYQVLVRISKSSVNIYENLNGEVRTSIIPITETMEVKLVDPSPDDYKSFEIVADNNGVQMVDSTESYTQWTWNVTPIKSGKSKLKIVISVIKNGNKKETVYEDNVEVKIDAINEIVFFIHKWWQWIIGALLLPVFKWLFGIWKKRRDEKKKKKKKSPNNSRLN